MADSPYTLYSIQLSGFRAYLTPKTFLLGSKPCLAVFAPNGSGKSSIIDALEFMFSEDGTLERLGLRTIDNNAGVVALAHNLADKREIPSFVSVHFSCGDQTPEGSRKAAGSERSRPPVVDAVNRRFIVSPLIRGHALRGFVEQTAEKRYEDVVRWLQLGPLVDVQRNLRTLRQQTKAAAENTAALQTVDTQLTRKTASAVKAWDEQALLAYTKTILAPLDAELSLKSLDRMDPAFNTLQQRAEAEEKRLGLAGLRQLLKTALVLHEEKEEPNRIGTLSTGLLVEFETAVDAQMGAALDEEAERNAAANAAFEELWKIAEPFFADGKAPLDSCPICTTPIAASTAGSSEGIRQHIAVHRAELADYARAKNALDDAIATVSRIHARLVTSLKALPVLLPDADGTLQRQLTSYLGVVESWTSGAVPPTATLKGSLKQLTTALQASIAEIESQQGENTYVKARSKLLVLIELKEERELAVRTLAELQTLSAALNAQAGFISGEIRRKVQALLNTLQRPINCIYREIQGENAAPIRSCRTKTTLISSASIS